MPLLLSFWNEVSELSVDVVPGCCVLECECEASRDVFLKGHVRLSCRIVALARLRSYES